MSKRINVNAFEMATPGHINQGVWRVPGSRRVEYNSLAYWIDLARTLERGLFDGIFFADVLGTYDIYQQQRDPAVRSGVQIPNLDPTYIIPAMAAVTKHLGFAATVTTTYEPPFGWARRLATLDHLTQGRFAWNVVTGYLPDAAKSFGWDEHPEHDERYDRAEEFMEVVYRLLERSWDDDAVLKDVERGVYTEPSRVHEIAFEGEYYRAQGPSLSEPSPQRTPLIFQAGTSDRGKAFAAKHAEAIIMHPRDEYHAKEHVDDLRARAVKNGRRAEDIKPFIRIETITGHNQEEVDAKIRILDEARDVEGQLAAFGGWANIDLSGETTDKYLQFQKRGAIQSIEQMWTDEGNQKNTAELVDYLSKPSNDRLFVAGTPDQVANRIEEIVDISGVDGLNLTSHLSPGTIDDFVDLIVPELQRRGRYRTAYTPGETFRERLYGAGQRHVLPGHAAAPIAAKRRQRAEAAE